MVFWVIAGAVVAGALALVFLPLLRGTGAGGRRASYDMQVYRDQLREVGRDVARGVVAEAEAEALRAEIGRKLLAAADAEAHEAEAARAPRRASLIGGGAVALAALAGTLWLYGGQGAPGYRDQPLAARLARQAEGWAARPRQAEAEAVARAAAPGAAAGGAVGEAAAGARGGEAAGGGGAPGAARPSGGAAGDALPPGGSAGVAAVEDEAPDTASAPGEAVALAERLAAALEARPDDLEGHRLMVRAMAGIGRYAEAAAAQGRVVAILGDAATAADEASHAELMIRAANGYVSPEAEAAIAEALRLDPRHPAARYFLGLMFVQGGWPAEAHAVWSALLAEGPPGAPWVAAIEAEIDAVAAMAGLPPAADAPAPAAGMPAAEGGPEDGPVDLERIEGMVASLAARLAAEGGPPEDWARLIRSLGVLGRIGEAAAIWEEAQGRFGADAAALGLLTEAARDARLVQ